MINKIIGKVLSAVVGIFLIALACYGIVWCIGGIAAMLA